jgi:hemoglobin
VTTVFSRIIDGELPARFVHTDDRCVAFLSINPLRAGHTLVVPRAEVDHWIDLDPADWQHLSAVARRIATAIQHAYRPAKVAAALAGLEVPHVHVHLVPIDTMTDLDFTRADPSPDPAALDEAAATIRAALAGLAAEPAETEPTDAEPEPPSLYDWAGGAPAIRRMIDAFYDRVEADDLLSRLFPGGVTEEHRAHVADWWCEVFGGPPRYTDEHGGYEHMLAKHRGLGISREQRFRFASLMSLAADDADLPDDPEFRAALVGYLEWGTRLALANSRPDAAVVEQAPVPRWGWGVAPPWQG